MTGRIITDSYTIGLASIIPDPSLTRQECERSTARMLAGMILGEECRINHHPDGAPYIAGQEGKTVSISHSSTLCAFGIAPATLLFGIDIESPRQQLERVSTKFLTPEEQSRLDAIRSADRRMDFLLKCWTAKEAVYKAARTPGLGLKEIHVDGSFTHAATQEADYRLTYHSAGEGQILCAACGKVS